MNLSNLKTEKILSQYHRSEYDMNKKRTILLRQMFAGSNHISLPELR